MTDTPNIPEPDPAWDYYIEWHKLAQAKAKLENLMAYLAEQEDATEETDEISRNDLQKILDLLDTI